MKIGFYLAHPAHYHLFKNVIREVRSSADVLVVYNQKDVLGELTRGFDSSVMVREVRTIRNIRGKLGLLFQFIQKVVGAYRVFRKEKPDVVYGTPILIALIGRALGFKSYIVNEDDFDVVKKTADFGYPHATGIICPDVCRTGKFSIKAITHPSYHELAYLHPDHFTADRSIVSKYFNPDQTYFIVRFAKLTAHHDSGIHGLSRDVAIRLIEILSDYGKVYITSERRLERELEPFQITIDPLDMHHVMAFSSLYVGDSQTMAAEAGVLGVPFIRFNDFVGRISYLDDLENHYQLGFGIKSSEPDELVRRVETLIRMKGLKEIFISRRQKMLSEKIDLAKFLSWFILNEPNSVEVLRNDPQYPIRFR